MTESTINVLKKADPILAMWRRNLMAGSMRIGRVDWKNFVYRNL